MKHRTTPLAAITSSHQASEVPRSKLPALLLSIYACACSWLYLPLNSTIYISGIDFLFPTTLLVIAMSKRISKNTVPAVLILYLSWAFAQTTLSQYSAPDPARLFRLTAIFAPALLLAVPFRLTENQLYQVIRYAWWGMTAAVAAGIVLHALGIQTRDAQQELWIEGGRSALRLAGITGNTAEFGHIAAIWAIMATTMPRILFRKHVGVPVSIVLTTFMYIVIFSSSRAALLNYGAATMLWLCIQLFTRRRRLKASFSLGALIGGYFIAIHGLRGLSPFIDASISRIDIAENLSKSSNGPADTRIATWNDAINDSAVHILQGIGYKNSVQRYGNAIDNAYLSNMVEFGTLGLALFIIFLLVIGYQVLRSDCAKSAKFGIFSIFIGTLFHGLTMDFHTMWASTPVLLSVITACIKTRRTKPAVEPLGSTQKWWTQPTAPSDPGGALILGSTSATLVGPDASTFRES